MKLRLLLICFVLTAGMAIGQKKKLDHTVYDQWKSVRNSVLSKNGEKLAYEINPHRGDGYLYWYDVNGGKKDSLTRGKRAVLKSNYLVGLIDPGYDTLRTLELEKVSRDKWVKDSLFVLWFDTDSIRKFDNISSFEVNENNDWLAFLRTENVEKPTPKKKKWYQIFKKKSKELEAYTSVGKQLNLYNPTNGEEHVIADVSDYEFSRNGKYLLYSKFITKEEKDSAYLVVFDLASGEEKFVTPGYTSLGGYNLDYQGDNLVFLASRDTVEKKKLYDLYTLDISKSHISKILDTNTVLVEGKTVSNFRAPNFSRDGKKIYFGLANIPEQDPEDTLLSSEKATLDLWHYKDKQLQPQQLLSKGYEERKTWLTVYHVNKDNKFTVLSNDTLNLRPMDHGNADVALGMSNEKYAGSYNWEYPWPADFYEVDLNTGEKTLLEKAIAYNAELSPKGNYFVYFNSDSLQLYLKDLRSSEVYCMTCGEEDANFLADMNGMPATANPFGTFGMTKAEDTILLHSEFDIWYYTLENHALKRITKGRENNIVYRLNLWDWDSTYLTVENTYVKAFDKVSKAEGIFTLKEFNENSEPTEEYFTDHALLYFDKAEEGSTIMYREMSLEDYPDVHVTTDNFETTKRASIANPQQSEYNWATVEQVSWKSYAGDSLNGLVYKPEDYDSTKNYPLLVYYYEMYSDELHNHYAPRPTASIIFATEYASAGYIVFFPDIRYEEGHPAQSAYDCIMSGTDKMLELYPNIDSTRMGLQGQSWGGYQTAQLITMTNRYAAAMAGAPVSNMFSAYGGIRWGSGLNRQFQYEKTQSRIGKTIWEAPELYVENSPIFHLPNVETPVMIMHNDNDGAVPWYQGIEMFVGLKRLGKPVWLLNYNGDGHNLMQNANRVDLSIRMRQFFDYYLLDAPAPEWLMDGIPAVEKGKEYRLELIEEK